MLFSTLLFFGFGVDLGGSGAPKCDPNCSLGPVLRLLGGNLEPILGARGPSWVLLGDLEPPWEHFGELFGQIRGRFGVDLCSIWE